VHSQSQQQSSQQQPPQQPLQQQQAAAAQQYREAQVPRPSQQPSTPEKPAWGYGLDLIGSQASAFWQNYQGQSLSIRTAVSRLSVSAFRLSRYRPFDRDSETRESLRGGKNAIEESYLHYGALAVIRESGDLAC